MRLKLFQLNIEEGKQQEAIVNFVKKEDFDILHFQEVNGGKLNASGIENFPTLKKALGYEGEQVVSWQLENDPTSYMSNAIFYKPSLPFVSTHREYLWPFAEIPEEEADDGPRHPSSAIDVTFSFSGRNLHCISTHLAWGPTPVDESYKVEQGENLINYVQSLSEPFILSGDFNVTADSIIVKKLNQLGDNHVVKHSITNTLNPNLHRVKSLFPKGLAVDFLYTHPSLTVTHFSLVDTPDLSDHFGLAVEVEL